jgi:hypothetical protein
VCTETRKRELIAALLMLSTLSPAPFAYAQGDAILKDLTAVIALQALPCDRVVSALRQAESDYVATCQNGNRYHVFVNAQGRVIVEKL